VPVALHLSRARQNSDRDGEVEGAPLLAHVGRGEVHGDPLGGHLEAGVLQRRDHPLLAFLDGAHGEADRGKGGKSAGHVRLDGDQIRIDAENGARKYASKHGRAGLKP
jgi:hypothetical protein